MTETNVSLLNGTPSSTAAATAVISSNESTTIRYSSADTDEELVGEIDDEGDDDVDDNFSFTKQSNIQTPSSTAPQLPHVFKVRRSADTTDNTVLPLFVPTNSFANAMLTPLPIATSQTAAAHAAILQQLRPLSSSASHVASHCPKNNNTSPLTHSSSNKAYHRRPKPPFSYVQLIAMAIRSTPSGRPTLQDINDYLKTNWEFFRGDYNGWKNSIRHNLSLNDCFHKILRDPARPWGKDNYWVLNPQSEDYVFDDKGVMRRKRKRVSPRQPHQHHRQNQDHRMVFNQQLIRKDAEKRETVSQEKVCRNNFAIDALIGGATANCGIKLSSSSAVNAHNTSTWTLPKPIPNNAISSVSASNTPWWSTNSSAKANSDQTTCATSAAGPGSAFAPVINCQEIFNRMFLDNAGSKCGNLNSNQSSLPIVHWPALSTATQPANLLLPAQIVPPTTLADGASLTGVNNSSLYNPAAAAWLVFQQMQAAAHHALANGLAQSPVGAISSAPKWPLPAYSQPPANVIAAAQYYAQLFGAPSNGLSLCSENDRSNGAEGRQFTTET